MKTHRTAGWTTNLEDSQSKALTLLMKGKQNMDTNRFVTVLAICPYIERTPRIRLERRPCAIVPRLSIAVHTENVVKLSNWVIAP